MTRSQTDGDAASVVASALEQPAGRESGGSTGVLAWLGALLPGLALAVGLAVLATLAQRLIGVAALSPLFLAIIAGMLIGNGLRPGPQVRPGIDFSLKRILRGAIILLGFQLTLSQIAAIGWQGVLLVVVCLAATFVFTKWAGRCLGVSRELSELIAAGTAVCGASAVIATNTVTRGKDEEVAYAIACVTVFGSIMMVVLPLAGTALAMAPETYGLWSGAVIHEVAQVVAAAFQGGDSAGEAGTVAKLSRVILLGPLVIVLGMLASRRARRAAAADQGGKASAPLPYFVFAFLAVVVLNSVIDFSDETHAVLRTVTTFGLTVALAAMGLVTDFGKLRAKGVRPMVLGALASLFIAALGLTLLVLLP
ncbi:YeiH family protein [Pseudohoeflea coraliihabitans]|uniref:YeiH family protein n=1 Tax=Pseudohoeflea coraliihabitans TaxID=2860393 RepID=A0ABS6WIR5_9HYPH|nr:YeiH family protein [Pseudohoeflea sp. DP4N28-3]MBW3095822.1 YeiH family protein [Pseudohoeflea sp. DP4N28-3]